MGRAPAFWVSQLSVRVRPFGAFPPTRTIEPHLWFLIVSVGLFIIITNRLSSHRTSQDLRTLTGLLPSPIAEVGFFRETRGLAQLTFTAGKELQ